LTTPPRTPRLPARPKTDGDSYTWMGLLWLVVMAGGFLALVTVIIPINLPVLMGIVAFLGLTVAVHLVLGRWVARHIAKTATDDEKNLE